MSKRVDFAIVLFLVFVAVVLSFYFTTNFLTSTILFFGMPSLFLLFRQRRQLKNIFFATFLFGLLFGFFLDYLAELNNAWSWAGTDQLVFSYKILGIVNVDVMIWFFLWTFFIIIFYEHFFEKDRGEKISPNFKYGLFLGLGAVFAIIIASFINVGLLNFGYAYLLLGFLALLPFIYVVKKKPVLLLKFFKAAIFFSILYLVYEITALSLDQWRFPGEYIGMVTWGSISFPIEEFVFWILLSCPVVLSYYELWVDDFK